jgi:hypothetical protein
MAGRCKELEAENAQGPKIDIVVISYAIVNDMPLCRCGGRIRIECAQINLAGVEIEINLISAYKHLQQCLIHRSEILQ